MKINFACLNESVVINYDGTTTTIWNDDPRYAKVLKAISENDLDSIPDIINVAKFYTAKNINFENNEVLVDGMPVPESIALRLKHFKEQNLPTDILVNFVRKLRKNPSFNSREQLFKFLEHNGHPITTEGNFIAYRGITEDFKDMHTKTFDNSPGSVCSIPRDQVDDNPNNTCSHGLHVACFSYAKDFGKKLVEVEVDPQDVVCVPTDYDGTKMRVCKFKVLSEVNTENSNVVVKSGYDNDSNYEVNIDWENDDTEIEDYDGNVDSYYTLKFQNTSSFIESARYNFDTNQLEVSIQGKLYTYDVSFDLIRNWELALSVGQYFNSYIR